MEEGEMKIEKFEDIQSWRKARELSNLVYDVTMRDSFTRDYVLSKQIRAASGSVMHNIAEGFDAGYDKEFIRFLKLTRRSATEVQSEIYLAIDRRYISQIVFTAIYEKAIDVKKLINAFIGYLSSSKS